MKRIATAAAIIALAVGTALIVRNARPARPGDYFPLTLGSSWEYQGEGNEFAAFTRTVDFVRGNRAQVREQNPGADSAFVFETGQEAITRVFSQPEFTQYNSFLDQPDNDSTVVLKAPLQRGTSWEASGIVREIIDTRATVITPAGRFENCLKVHISFQEADVFEYYKKNVGLVKREFIAGQVRISSTLLRYNVN